MVGTKDDQDEERIETYVNETKKQLPSDLQEQDGVWHRGLGSVALEPSMDFLIPVVSNTSRTNSGQVSM